MTLKPLSVAAIAASLLCATPIFADGHSGGGLLLEVPKNICTKTRNILERWAADETQYTAYVTTITSEQAAADCFDIDRNSKLYAASHAKVKFLATTKALAKCTQDNKRLDWCVVIGTLNNK
ncbi:hypothetical protein [Amylibacter sp. IMCC11727]|uniref:hypothetical protein n=1 Tax=Amylibacter sp. IMCC11727 TaxID=3039851 RepID=UPI00244D9F3E|nr:hypothetical protein [Amylibacter sp. IMCC11727]WGI22173.1 hypothetical protein QBD29_01775 [Amylibacter sp. IMCC11727]